MDPKIIFFLSILIQNSIVSQNPLADSLKLILKNTQNDTVRSKVLNTLIEEESDINIWINYNEELNKICQRHLNTKEITKGDERFYKEYFANSINYFGTYKEAKGDIFEAVTCYKKSLTLFEELNDMSGIAITLGNLGSIANLQGNIPLAIDYYQRSLTIQEKLGDTYGIAIVFNNLGFMYTNQFDYKSSIDYFNKSLKLRYATGDRSGAALCLSNIAGTMLLKVESKLIRPTKEQKQKDILDAYGLFKRSNAIYDSLGDKKGVAMIYNSMGFLFKTYGKLMCSASHEVCSDDGSKTALTYLLKSLEMRKQIGEKKRIAESYVNVGAMYQQFHDNAKALEYSQIGLKMGKELGYPTVIRLGAWQLWDTYKETGNYKEALANYELYIQMRDSLNNVTNRKATVKQQLRYEYEKRAAADSVSHAKESEIKNAELSRQSAEIKVKKNQQYALFGGLGLVIIFAGFMYNRFKITQKQKEIIEDQKSVVEQQKQLVEAKQKEILDSIHYAKRIQLAQIPNEKQISSMLKRTKGHEG